MERRGCAHDRVRTFFNLRLSMGAYEMSNLTPLHSNIAAQHSRLPWTKGDRKILASLWDSGLETFATEVKTF
jgi:hypothetical protein